jgi:hypothetical protein
MNLSIGNKNVIAGLIVILVFLSMTFFIERTASLLQFHDKAAAAVVDKKGSSNLLDHQITDIKRGAAYREGGIYFTNMYPNSYTRVMNSYRDAGYNMRLYAWIFAIFGIIIGVIVGTQTKVSIRLRSAASWLALAGVILYPVRDSVYFWGRYLNPDFAAGGPGPVLYPILWVSIASMFLALFLSLVIFIKGTRK